MQVAGRELAPFFNNIERGSEANAVINNFNALTQSKKQDVLNFATVVAAISASFSAAVDQEERLSPICIFFFDLFAAPVDAAAHQRYQDAVARFGVEGHLRALADEYAALALKHPDDFRFAYLRTRALIGRNTPSVIRRGREILKAHPDFVPAHCALVKIIAFRHLVTPPVWRIKSAQDNL